MEGVQSILTKIRQVVDSRSVDIEGELIGYDAKHNGQISKVSLHRWLCSLGVNVSNSEIQRLCLSFQAGEGVDWRKLQASIESTKPVQAHKSTRLPPCTNELSQLQKEVSRRSGDLRSILHESDPYNRGKVSTDRFYRAFGSNPMTHTIARYYSDPISGDIDYFRLQDDLSKASKVVVEEPPISVQDLPQGFEDLARFIQSRSIDIGSMFQRSGGIQTSRIPSNTFATRLAQIGAPITPRALDAIVRAFTESDGLVSINRFQTAVDSVQPLSSRTQKPTTQRMSPDELLDEVRKVHSSRHLDLELHFQNVEREFHGQPIPKAIFIQHVQSLNYSLDKGEIEAICQMFETRDGSIDYRAFVRALMPEVTATIVSGSDVLTRLKEHLKTSPYRLKPIFMSFDREGSGNVTIPQLESTLRKIEFEFNRQDLYALRDEYPGSSRGTVSWSDISGFCDPLNIPKQTEEVQESMTRPVSAHRRAPPPAVEQVLRSIKQKTVAQQISLVEIFRQRDQYRRGQLTLDAFQGVLIQNPFNITPTDLRTLTNFYRRSGSNEFDYIYMCDDIDSLVEEKPQAIKTLTTTRVTISNEVKSLLSRLKLFCESRMMSAEDVFGVCDRTNSGVIPASRIDDCLQRISFRASSDEVQQLAQAFAHPSRKDMVSYVRIAKEMDLLDTKNEDTRAAVDSAPIPTEVLRAASAVNEQIREKLSVRHRSIRSAFAGVSSQTIPSKDFAERIGSLGFVVRTGELQALIRRYRVRMTDEISWQEFCSDVESSHLLGED